MRKALLMTGLIVPILAVAAYALQNYVLQPGVETYGYSSEGYYGGSSYLGVDTRDITSDRVAALKLKEERGVEVTMVDQDAPAGKAGVKEHDVILTVNGNKVESVEELRRMIHEIPPGRVITLGISRDGQSLELKAQLADRKKAFAVVGPQGKEFHFEMPAMPKIPDMDLPVSIVVVHSSIRSGLMVENLTPQLGDFLGAKNGQGVLVRSVEKGSYAEKAGFRAGDVIVKVNTETVSDAGDFTHALRSQKAGGTVSVGIIRDKKEQTLTLTLPERRESGDIFEEESFDEDPEIDAETRIDLSEVQSEMARMKPQLSLAVQEARKAAEDIRKQFCEKEQELQQQKEELRQEQQDEIREQQQELQDQLREQQDEMREQMLEQQQELNDGQREVRGGRAEI